MPAHKSRTIQMNNALNPLVAVGVLVLVLLVTGWYWYRSLSGPAVAANRNPAAASEERRVEVESDRAAVEQWKRENPGGFTNQ